MKTFKNSGKICEHFKAIMKSVSGRMQKLWDLKVEAVSDGNLSLTSIQNNYLKHFFVSESLTVRAEIKSP